jgi:hypothetical protein
MYPLSQCSSRCKIAVQVTLSVVTATLSMNHRSTAGMPAFPDQGKNPDFLALSPLHEQVHVLAARLVKQHTSDQFAQALEGLGALYAVRDRLLQHLRVLSRTIDI